MSSTRVHRPIRTYTHALGERRNGNNEIPYGCYKYDSGKNYLPGGLFHFVKDGDLYVPTLHGLSSDYIKNLKDVAVCSAGSAIANRPFLNAPHMYEVELINTGYEPLKQGDRFTVQLPSKRDVAAQMNFHVDPGYDISVNKCIWGGLLATRRVNLESGGDPVEEVIQAIKDESDFDVFQLISPYTPQSILSMMTLVANGGGYYTIGDDVRASAAAAVNDEYQSDIVTAIVNNDAVKQYLKTVLAHALTVVECVQGFASGQVIRSCNGYNTSIVNTGDRFMACVNTSRWLS